ncbi:MAG TPA: NifU family protein [Solirubrobacteraceae bacterium]|nr:NifU family protein [Solirubrobacteraceae bacterium]
MDDLFDRLGELLPELEQLDEPVRGQVFEFLDGLEALHRSAVHRLADGVGEAEVARLRKGDPAVDWLFGAYGVGVDEREEVEAALEEVRPYIESHGGSLEVLGVADGMVRVKLAGSCSGCTASAVTLREGVEKALRENVPGFAGLEVEEEDAEAHPPPGPTLLQIENVEAQQPPPPAPALLQIEEWRG